MKLAICIFASILSATVLAGQFDDMTAQGHDFASDQKSYLDGLANGTDSRATQYGGKSTVTADLHPCNQPNEKGQITCGGEAVDQSQSPESYYGMSKTQLEDNARMKASTDSTAAYMYESHDKREVFDINRDDPLFKNMESNQNKMVDLGKTYSGCKEIAYGGTVKNVENKTCKKTGVAQYQDTNCTRVLNVMCSGGAKAPNFSIKNGDGLAYLTQINSEQSHLTTPITTTSTYLTTTTYLGFTVSTTPYWYYYTSPCLDAGCNGFNQTNTVHLTLNKSAFSSKSFLYLSNWWTAATFRLKINGSIITPTYAHDNVSCMFLCISEFFYMDIGTKLKEGENTFVFEYNNGSGWSGAGWLFTSLYFYNLGGECEESSSTSLTCENGASAVGKTLVSQTCIDSANPKTIDGFSISKACWKWSEVYREEIDPAYTEEAGCAELRAAGCGLISNTCNLTSSSGWCSDATLTFTCESEHPEKTMQVCGDTLVCPDGHCYDSYKKTEDATPDFLKSASYLAAMEDMKKEFDPNNISVWKGEYQQCSLKSTLVGSDKCCTGGSGFLNTLGASCNDTEKKIISAKKDERVTKVAEWEVCSQKVLGVCIEHKTYYGFCLWPSKLARIIQDQGRPMLGQVVANPCPGFKLQNPNEFEGIDWSRIDLSEYYTDVQSKYAATPKPSPGAVTQQMQQSNQALQDEYAAKMQQYYGK